MKKNQKIWEQIASDIEKDYKRGNPTEWKKDKVDIFLAHMRARLISKCKIDKKIAKVLESVDKKNVPFKSEELSEISYETFYRIFNKRTSPGSKKTLNYFAIYLGYDAIHHYIEEKNIKEDDSLEYSETISFEEFIEESNVTNGLIHYFEQLQDNFEKQIYHLLKKINQRLQKSTSLVNPFGFTFFAPALDKNELDEVYCVMNFNNQFLSEADVNSCIKSMNDLKKSTWKIFAYTLVCNAQLNSEQLKRLKEKTKDLIEDGIVEYSADVYDVKGFVKNCINQMNPILRDQIIMANQKYESDYKTRMEQFFYLKEIPFTIDDNPKVLLNPLAHLKTKQKSKSSEWELMELLLEAPVENKSGEWFVIISEFGFGKTSLFLSFFKLLQKGNIDVLFIPIAQLPAKSFQNTNYFCRSILNILYNKKYVNKGANTVDSESHFVDFFDQNEVFVELMVMLFKEILLLRSDIVILFDGLDEHALAYEENGLKQIFNSIEPLQVKCFFSVREEFWYDKQGGIDKAIKREVSEIIFLKEWNKDIISAYIKKYIEQLTPPKEEKSYLEAFVKIINEDEYEKNYGDIPKRPLFLNMIVQDIVKGNFQKRNLSGLYENYLQQKFSYDLIRAFEENNQLKSMKSLKEEDEIKVLNKMFAVLTQVSSLMVFNNKEYEAVLLADITEDKIEHTVSLIKEKFFSITEILLNSVLIPINKRRTLDDFRVKFAHKSFQEYFTARYLFELLKYPGQGREQRDYDMFRYKFDTSIIRFLIGILENEQQRNQQNFDKCMEILALVINEQSLESESIGLKLKNKFLL